MEASQKITPFLWFSDNLNDVINFYRSVFKNASLTSLTQIPAEKSANGASGKMQTAMFNINGQAFMALNGDPIFKFNPAISFFVSCATQDEVDDLWDKLTADGGQPSQCGWLQDKYGLSWQIVPELLGKLMGDKDPKKAKATMEAMMKMSKIDTRLLQEAYDAA